MKTPTISMRDFYDLPHIKGFIEVQKHNPYGSIEHLRAHKLIKECAKTYNADQYIGEY
ncbi:MAG: hypothetical protein OEX12_11550 [Gammaproteobacteria bacterium]|nr:hypothetical protein [Gammaproteobacteria bacterium]